MDFFAARLGSPTEGIYVFSLDGKKFLLGAGLSLNSLMHYLPNFGEFIDDAVLDASNQKLPTQQDKTSKPIKQMNANPYYLRINGKSYIRYPIKFDLSHYDLIDLRDIDYILVANTDCLAALPYLTEYTKFNGKVLATTPVAQVGSHILQEFCNDVIVANKTPKEYVGSFFEESKLFDVFEDEGLKIQEWVDIYSSADIQNCFSKIIPLNFNQNYPIEDDFLITPISSGYSFGSCNWILNIKSQKIALICNSAIESNGHWKPIDIENLKNSEIVVLTQTLNSKYIHSIGVGSNDLSEKKISNTDYLKNDLMHALQSHLNSSTPGNVLIPMSDPQIALTLMPFFSYNRANINRVHIISSSFEAFAAYANISVEYLHDALGQKIYVEAKEVFPIEEMKKIGKLVIYEDIATFQKTNLKNDSGVFDYGSPSFYFVSHSSFRIGHSAKFLDFFINSQKRTPLLILSDPKVNDALLLAPFATKKLEIRRCYIDADLTFKEASSIIETIKFSNEGARFMTLVVPKTYQTNKSDVNAVSLVVNKKIKIFEFGEDEEIHIELGGSNFRRCQLSFEKPLEEMSAKDILNGMKMYSIEGTLRLNEEDSYEATVKEANETNEDIKTSQAYLNLLGIDKKLQNLTRELEKFKLSKIFVGKMPGENKNEERIKALYNINPSHTQLLILHDPRSTTVYFSERVQDEAAINLAIKKALGLTNDSL